MVAGYWLLVTGCWVLVTGCAIAKITIQVKYENGYRLQTSGIRKNYLTPVA